MPLLVSPGLCKACHSSLLLPGVALALREVGVSCVAALLLLQGLQKLIFQRTRGGWSCLAPPTGMSIPSNLHPSWTLLGDTCQHPPSMLLRLPSFLWRSSSVLVSHCLLFPLFPFHSLLKVNPQGGGRYKDLSPGKGSWGTCSGCGGYKQLAQCTPRTTRWSSLNCCNVNLADI